MKVDNSIIMANKIIAFVQRLLGVAGLVFFGLAFLGNILDVESNLDAMDIILFAFFISLHAFLFYCGKKRAMYGRKLKNYGNVIGNVASISIVDIAQSVQVAETQVINDFEWLINKGLLADAYIDFDDRKIVFKEAYAKVVEEQQQEEQAKRNIEYISVMCECCNGTTKIVKGKEGVCSYCGAPIQ